MQILKTCAYVNLREIKELGLACVAIKDNSIILLEFVFDLNFDEIIFPENPIKIV